MDECTNCINAKRAYMLLDKVGITKDIGVVCFKCDKIYTLDNQVKDLTQYKIVD